MDDAAFMQQAIALARRGRGMVAPNPLVGAVVVANGQVLGEGWHEGPGTPHAEVVALEAAGQAADGASLYTTLEPCAHVGRTGPCSDAIIASGVSRVAIGVEDPTAISGDGMAQLRGAGITVDLGVEAAAVAQQIRPFLHHAATGSPFVVLKMAVSLDGKIATSAGSTTQLTSERARADVHRIRGDVGAIIVGSGTAIADQPRLTVRDETYPGRAPLRVVLDGRGRVPPTGPLFDGTAPTLVVTTDAGVGALPGWEAAGAEAIVLSAREGGGVSFEPILKELGARGIDAVLVEGGGIVAAAAIADDVIDRLVIYYAPMFLGGDAVDMVGPLGGIDRVGGRLISIDSVTPLGPDLKVEADVHRDR